MVTYLDLLNRAAARFRQEPLNSSTITGTSGEALVGVQATNEAVAEVYELSTDWDFNDPINNFTTTIGASEVTQPAGQTVINPQIINAIKLVDGNNYIDLLQISPERAKELEFIFGSSQKRPLFFYVNQGKLYVTPLPDAVYTLEVFYQGIVPQITSGNITDTVVLPVDLENTLVSGIYAYLRRAQGDPEWTTLEQLFKNKLNRATIRNKYSMKTNGLKKFRMKLNPDRCV